MVKLLILDRDGVLNKVPQVGERYISKVKDLEINQNFIRKLEGINSEISLCVISNQQGVGRNIISLETIHSIEDKIQESLSSIGCKITKFYYCFHQIESKCSCRKPKIGNFLKAFKDFEVTPNQCLYIGDQKTDEIAARYAKIRFYYEKQLTNQLIISL